MKNLLPLTGTQLPPVDVIQSLIEKLEIKYIISTVKFKEDYNEYQTTPEEERVLKTIELALHPFLDTKDRSRWVPRYELKPGRSHLPEDFSQADLQTLLSLAAMIDVTPFGNHLKAYANDFMWSSNKREKNYAVKAAYAFMNLSIELIDSNKVFYIPPYISRAFYLVEKLKNNHPISPC